MMDAKPLEAIPEETVTPGTREKGNAHAYLPSFWP